MQSLVHFLEVHLPIVLAYKYLFLFIGGMFEGLNTIVLGGFLSSVGAVKTLPMFLLFIVGYTLEGYMWYLVGYFAGAKPIDKFVRKSDKGQRIMEKVEHYFHRYSGRAIVFTKVTFSLTIATLIMAGSLKYNLKKFSIYNFIGSIGWVSMVFSVGYFFGASYQLMLAYFKSFVYGLLFLGGAIVLIYVLKFIFTSAFTRSLYITEKLREVSDKLKNGIDKFLSDKE